MDRVTLLPIALLICSVVLTTTGQSSDDPGRYLTWRRILRPHRRGALCNDFSPAGYFIRTNPPSPHQEESGSASHLPLQPDWRDEDNNRRKWVIFLEGGGGCTTPKSCNERFIDQTIREKFTTFVNGSLVVDVEGAWKSYQQQPLLVTSKLMTSVLTFSETGYPGLYHFKTEVDGIVTNQWGVEGRGILSTSKMENPDFYQHNHVLVPYCSSDLWLKRTRINVNQRQPGYNFHFDPLQVDSHQFTFRGAVIFRSVVMDLLATHGFSSADEVIFGGSSAGGVGAMNHAHWLKDTLLASTGRDVSLHLIIDSAWFIDFRGEITNVFPPEEFQTLARSNEIIETCIPDQNNTTLKHNNEALACISAPLLLSSRKFPPDVPVLAIFSRYDLYLLVQALARIEDHSDGNLDILELMRVVSEYSGSMNATLQKTATILNKRLSYYITSCFQHVYLATSSLWGEGALFGTASVDGAATNNRFQHVISSEIWNTFQLEHLSHTSPNKTATETTPISLPLAVHLWMNATRSDSRIAVQFQDACDGPYCNPQCPETVVLGEVSPHWSDFVQGVILTVVAFAAVVCAVLKLGLSLMDIMISLNQKNYLKGFFAQSCMFQSFEASLPYCNEAKAISIACLDLKYSVTIRKNNTTPAMAPRSRLISLAAAISGPSFAELGVSSEDWLKKEDDSKTEDDAKVSVTEFFNSLKLPDTPSDPPPTSPTKSKESFFNRFLARTKRSSERKQIIKGISMYFNPGELVAIMGPSGCGKTTFLDLLAGRRKGSPYQGEILVNGIVIDKVRNWYISNTGYVLQLATPYYEDLTVRENLTLAAHMRLAKSLTPYEKFRRVEQVLNETGLSIFASVQVGGLTGPGLSGGQKRRLCVAIQLLSMPSLIFLDEPTSGLDSTSSLELLNHLNRVASSNRTVILTIHQPRLEIFHMFHKILLLCQGQIAYHGIPEKVYEVFLSAYKASDLPSKELEDIDSKNPADMVLDMLQSEEARTAILSYYQTSDEPEAVRAAIEDACKHPGGLSELQTKHKVHQEAGILNRLMALEARASKRSRLSQTLYLPVIFIVYGILLGTVYFQTQNSTFILSALGVFSCASGLFMFPAIYTYLFRALEIFSLEVADGIGSPLELVAQTFLRYTTLSCLPVLLCSAILYLLVIPASLYNFWVFVQMTVFTIALNQTWIALLIFVIMFQPYYAHRLSPVISAVAGFSGGFFVPFALMPPWYKWLFFINPNFYGFTAITRTVLEELELSCPYKSTIECYPTSSRYLLTYFSLHLVNPYAEIVVLLGMSVGFLTLAWLALMLRHSSVIPKIKKYFKKRRRDSQVNSASCSMTSEEASNEFGSVHSRQLASVSVRGGASETELRERRKGSSISNLEFKKVMVSSPDQPEEGTESLPQLKQVRRQRYRNRRETHSHMLQDGEKHQVWKPGCNQRKFKSQESPDERKISLINRINTCRQTTMERAGNEANRERRMEQWKKIQDEADEQKGLDEGKAEKRKVDWSDVVKGVKKMGEGAVGAKGECDDGAGKRKVGWSDVVREVVVWDKKKDEGMSGMKTLGWGGAESGDGQKKMGWSDVIREARRKRDEQMNEGKKKKEFSGEEVVVKQQKVKEIKVIAEVEEVASQEEEAAVEVKEEEGKEEVVVSKTQEAAVEVKGEDVVSKTQEAAVEVKGEEVVSKTQEAAVAVKGEDVVSKTQEEAVAVKVEESKGEINKEQEVVAELKEEGRKEEVETETQEVVVEMKGEDVVSKKQEAAVKEKGEEINKEQEVVAEVKGEGRKEEVETETQEVVVEMKEEDVVSKKQEAAVEVKGEGRKEEVNTETQEAVVEMKGEGRKEEAVSKKQEAVVKKKRRKRVTTTVEVEVGAVGKKQVEVKKREVVSKKREAAAGVKREGRKRGVPRKKQEAVPGVKREKEKQGVGKRVVQWYEAVAGEEKETAEAATSQDEGAKRFKRMHKGSISKPDSDTSRETTL